MAGSWENVPCIAWHPRTVVLRVQAGLSSVAVASGVDSVLASLVQVRAVGTSLRGGNEIMLQSASCFPLHAAIINVFVLFCSLDRIL